MSLSMCVKHVSIRLCIMMATLHMYQSIALHMYESTRHVSKSKRSSKTRSRGAARQGPEEQQDKVQQQSQRRSKSRRRKRAGKTRRRKRFRARATAPATQTLAICARRTTKVSGQGITVILMCAQLDCVGKVSMWELETSVYLFLTSSLPHVLLTSWRQVCMCISSLSPMSSTSYVVSVSCVCLCYVEVSRICMSCLCRMSCVRGMCTWYVCGMWCV
jgi:hypothetical protein